MGRRKAKLWPMKHSNGNQIAVKGEHCENYQNLLKDSQDYMSSTGRDITGSRTSRQGDTIDDQWKLDRG